MLSLARPDVGVANQCVPFYYFKNYNDSLSTHMMPLWSYGIESLNNTKLCDNFFTLRTCTTLLRDQTSDESPASIVEEIVSDFGMGCISIIEP